jgi:hypothetical protein
VPDEIDPATFKSILARTVRYRSALEQIARLDEPHGIDASPDGCDECWSVEIATAALIERHLAGEE